jgi:hypothetical protein
LFDYRPVQEELWYIFSIRNGQSGMCVAIFTCVLFLLARNKEAHAVFILPKTRFGREYV